MNFWIFTRTWKKYTSLIGGYIFQMEILEASGQQKMTAEVMTRMSISIAVEKKFI